jgi:uncharacterized iron-regulated membrane protein
MKNTLNAGKKRTHGGFKVRAALLVLQICLPFGLYFALSLTHLAAAMGIAFIFLLSMAVLVWMG